MTALQEQNSKSADTIVHLAIGTHVDKQNRMQSILVKERPFIGELELDTNPDDPALLIAVGEMLGVKQPLSATRITCLGSMAILWLNNKRWLVLRAPGSRENLSDVLSQHFGSDIRLEESHEGIKATLSCVAINYLLSSYNTIECNERSSSQSFAVESDYSVFIESLENPQSGSEHEVLVRKKCAEALWDWLNQ